MFLKSLTITRDTRVVREIVFRRGINLIVDETPSSQGKETGNNVGKTTVLMLIDFCFGANSKHIYTDPENKKEEYKTVKDFLVDNKILITLVLKDDLGKDDSREVCIERNFLSRKNRIQRIDGVNKADDEFEEALTNILFPGHYGKKPTFRQIISHNIRYKDLSISHTLKTLDVYTRDDEYETLYLFLLGCGFEEGDTKQGLLTQIRLEHTFKSRLEKGQTKAAYEVALALLSQEIEALDRKKASFNLNENFEAELNKLNQIKYQINLTSSQLTKLRIRRDLIIDTRSEILAGRSEIDMQQLRLIYEQATSIIGAIQKSFEDLCNFHNQMVAEKAKYISKELPDIESQIKAKSEYLKQLLLHESELAGRISRSASFEELEGVISELNEKYRKKGEYENIVQQLTTVESELGKLNERLRGIDDALFSEEAEQKIKAQVNKFNNYFSAISNTLYGEQYALKAEPTMNNKGQRLYKFSAFNTNFSSGKKQGEISCFDIAYTLFADEEGIPCMHFLLNDKKELMHGNQLSKIAELVNGENIQFVASILKDKLPDDLNREEYFVVKLSQTEKLFRIEAGTK